MYRRGEHEPLNWLDDERVDVPEIKFRALIAMAFPAPSTLESSRKRFKSALKSYLKHLTGS
jgi:hypothetical protein